MAHRSASSSASAIRAASTKPRGTTPASGASTHSPAQLQALAAPNRSSQGRSRGARRTAICALVDAADVHESSADSRVAALARFYRGRAGRDPGRARRARPRSPARSKMKLGGGNAGHNGLQRHRRRSSAAADFWRLRLGIGHPRDSAHPAAGSRRLRAAAAARRRARCDRRRDRRGRWRRGRAIAAGDSERAMHDAAHATRPPPAAEGSASS